MASGDKAGWLAEFIRTLADSGRVRHVRKGEKVYSQGSEAQELHLILKGEISLTTSNGRATATIETLGPHRWLFEGVHELSHVYLTSAVATVDSDVARFPRDHIDDLPPQLREMFFNDIFEHLHTLMALHVQQFFSSYDVRLARKLRDKFDGKTTDTLRLFEWGATRFARLIGSTRQTADKIIPRFLAAGILTKTSNKSYMLHKGALDKYLTKETTDAPDDGDGKRRPGGPPARRR